MWSGNRLSTYTTLGLAAGVLNFAGVWKIYGAPLFDWDTLRPFSYHVLGSMLFVTEAGSPAPP